MKNKRISLLLPALLLLAGTAGILLGAGKAAEIWKIRHTRLVVWEAPKSMRVGTEEDMSVNTELVRPMDLVLSPSVSLAVNGAAVPVYETNVSNTHTDSAVTPLQSRTPVAIFDFEGIVSVKVSLDRAPETAEILPSASGIGTAIEGSDVTFTLREPGHYTLILDGAPERAFHFFTRLPEEDVPREGDEKILY
ncbi:MAG: hypothetical protein IKX85_03530, partial [Clostridia bacterium]|nr:hypothetical protein [Clostridia bacterium]